MDYVEHYKCGFSSLNQTGWVHIYEDGYSGGIEELTTLSDSVQVQYKWNGWEDPIIGLSASFSIVNTKDNFFDLLPLLTAEEREYWIKIEQVTPASVVMFEGYLNCIANEQKYLKKQPIKLHASSYLSKLKYVNAPTIETLEVDSFIDIIDDCLTQTGTENNIRVHSSLVPTEDALGTTKTVFNLTGVYKEVFWKDNIERDSALDVIKKILIAFDCYICWYNGYWWIERYADIWNLNSADQKNWVEYTSGDTYHPLHDGSAGEVTETIYDFVDLVKLDTSQVIGMTPGKKQVEIKVEQQTLFNLINPDLTDIAKIYAGTPEPLYRRWLKWEKDAVPPMSWDFAGLPFYNIANSILRSDWEGGGAPEYHRGIYTRFKMTVSDDTTLTIKFKANPSLILDYDIVDLRFRWYLRHLPGEFYIVEYSDSSVEWGREASNETDAIQIIEVPGSELDKNRSIEVSTVIPMGDVDGLTDGDHEFVLCIATEDYDENGIEQSPFGLIHYGDVQVIASGTLPDNYISGAISTGFLDKLSIELYLFDADDLSIKNGIMRSSLLDTRTILWEDDLCDSTETYTLTEIKLRDKFLLYNISRQKITSKVQSIGFPKPFTLHEDSNQAGLYFILTGYTYEPQHDRMTAILSEYDNTETINLV